mgnify:CR=1 FL=1
MYGDDSDDDGDEKEYVDEHADKNADLGSTRYEKSPETVSVLRCARKDGNDCVDDDDDDLIIVRKMELCPDLLIMA